MLVSWPRRRPPVHEADARHQHARRSARRRAPESKPHSSAAAAPGITPWASASPRKVRPRSTTHVPTSDDATTASSPASRPAA